MSECVCYVRTHLLTYNIESWWWWIGGLWVADLLVLVDWRAVGGRDLLVLVDWRAVGGRSVGVGGLEGCGWQICWWLTGGL